MAAASRTDRSTFVDGDWLTGFLNRGECLSRLATMLAQVQGGDEQIAVLWINVDRFRKINSSFGYSIADSVLVELARRLERIGAASRILARMSGDEFVLAMACRSEDEAKKTARSVLSGLARPLGIGTHQLRPSVSIGVALSGVEDAATELLERADRLMMEAKRLGGGRFIMQPPVPQTERGGKVLAREELTVEEMLHRSLEEGGLYLDYQPIIRVADGTPLAAEALMRCRVGNQNSPPGRFIPVAEKTGLIMHLGDWCLITAAGFIRHLDQQGIKINVAVNVSRAQLLTPSFAKSLHGVLAVTGISPAQLELEITESLFMDSSDAVQKNLHAVIEAGFPLALDDFGTGYSSLACLKDLPASKIKLDRAFVIDLPHDRRSFGVAKAVAQLAAELDITLVAEGVETKEQFDAMRAAGVTAVQGFYVARPMGEVALQHWLGGGKQ